MNDDTKLKIVVLGAGGFLGSSMTRHLADAGHDVTAYWRQPLTEIANHANVTSVIADLRDTWILADVLVDVDVVYHFASGTHPSLFFSNPSAEYWEALQPLLVMMETASRVGVKKIVFPSSGGTIYANSAEPRSEESATDPRSPYAILKLAAEQLLHHASRLGQFSVDVFRIGNPYGPGQRPRPGQGVLSHWIEAIRSNRPIRVFGDGSAQRDYIYIDDLCQMMAISCDRLESSDTFNVGTGIATSLTELVGHLQSHAKYEHEVIHIPGRPSDIQSIALAPDRLLTLMPEFKFTPLNDGIRKTLEFHNLA